MKRGKPSMLLERMRAGREAIFVWSVVLAMTAYLAWYLTTYASPVPMQDDLEVLRLYAPGFDRNLSTLWGQHNEHRVPLPVALQVGLLYLSGDFRSGMWFEAALLVFVTVVMLVVARALRGRTSWVDALFPLVWLHPGLCDNLLMGFQIALLLPSALVSLVIACIARFDRGLSPRVALVCALSIAALPLCGGPGLTQVPPLLAWMLVLGIIQVQGETPRARRAGKFLLGGVALTAAIIAAYFVDWQEYPSLPHTLDPFQITAVSTRVLSLVIGPAASEWWPWTAVGIVGLSIGTIDLLVVRFIQLSDQRVRIFGLVCALGATLCLAIAIGYGRGRGDPVTGFANRYGGLPAPILCTIALAFELYASRAARLMLGGFACASLAAALFVVDLPYAEKYGSLRRDLGLELQSAIDARETPAHVIETLKSRIYDNSQTFFYLFTLAERAGIAPFARREGHVLYPWSGDVFLNRPGTIASSNDDAVIDDISLGFRAVVAPAGTCIAYPIEPADQSFSGAYGLVPGQGDEHSGSRLVIAMRDDDGFPRVLFDTVLDPNNPAHVGPIPLQIALPEHAKGMLTVRFLGSSKRTSTPAEAYWTWSELR